MRSAQHHARRTPRLQRFLPARCAQTPAIIGLQSRKAEFRHRRREIIAAGLRELEKTHGHDGAHGVAAVVLAAGVAAAVAKESRHRAQGADFESIAEHVLGLVAPASALASVISQHRNSLHRRSLPTAKTSIPLDPRRILTNRPDKALSIEKSNALDRTSPSRVLTRAINRDIRRRKSRRRLCAN